jgi:hypothetical protein
MEVMDYLAEEFPITFSILDIHLLISKQLFNSMEVLKINADSFFELGPEEKDFFEKKLITGIVL